MRAEAGFEKKLDCKVIVDLKESGGLNVTLHSSLEGMFGKQMKENVYQELADLGIENADVEIFDEGSLDFVIRARVKTAVGRARGGQYE